MKLFESKNDSRKIGHQPESNHVLVVHRRAKIEREGPVDHQEPRNMPKIFKFSLLQL